MLRDFDQFFDLLRQPLWFTTLGIQRELRPPIPFLPGREKIPGLGQRIRDGQQGPGRPFRRGPPQGFLNRHPQPYREGSNRKIFHPALDRRPSSTRGKDDLLFLQELGTHFFLRKTEMGLTMLAEDLRNGKAYSKPDFLIEVPKSPPEAAGESLADPGLSASHEPHQKDSGDKSHLHHRSPNPRSAR